MNSRVNIMLRVVVGRVGGVLSRAAISSAAGSGKEPKGWAVTDLISDTKEADADITQIYGRIDPASAIGDIGLNDAAIRKLKRSRTAELGIGSLLAVAVGVKLATKFYQGEWLSPHDTTTAMLIPLIYSLTNSNRIFAIEIANIRLGNYVRAYIAAERAASGK